MAKIPTLALFLVVAVVAVANSAHTQTNAADVAIANLPEGTTVLVNADDRFATHAYWGDFYQSGDVIRSLYAVGQLDQNKPSCFAYASQHSDVPLENFKLLSKKKELISRFSEQFRRDLYPNWTTAGEAWVLTFIYRGGPVVLTCFNPTALLTLNQINEVGGKRFSVRVDK